MWDMSFERLDTLLDELQATPKARKSRTKRRLDRRKAR
jgi:hypothetical protein